MIIPPEKIVELLTGSASGGVHPTGGTPGELALSRAEIARALGVPARNEQLRELIRSMTAAGYLRREHRPGGWVYVLGRPLDDPDRPPGPTPGFTMAQTARARLDIIRLRQTPTGRRPGNGVPGKIVHGVNMRPLALCGRDVTELHSDIPLRTDVDVDLDLIGQRETWTVLVEDATCPGCIAARNAPTADELDAGAARRRTPHRFDGQGRLYGGFRLCSCTLPREAPIHTDNALDQAPAAPRGRRPGQIVPGAPEPFDATAEDVVHGANRPDKTLCFVPIDGMPEFDITVAHGLPSYTRTLDLMTCAACLRVGDDAKTHGLLPAVSEFTACGDLVGNLHNPNDKIVDASLTWPAPGSIVTCHPCREEIDAFARDAERRRKADELLAQGQYVHLVVGHLHALACGIERVGLFLPEGHVATVFPAEVNCAGCIAANGGHRGPRGHGYTEGRTAAGADVDTSTRPEHNFVQGLASARAERYERMLADMTIHYANRCTYTGEFNSEHPYENSPEQVAESRVGNFGYDEWERCEKPRTDVLHIGQPEADRAWLRQQFEYESCHECGGDVDEHRVMVNAIGMRFAQCLDENGDPPPGIDAMTSTAGATEIPDGRCMVSVQEIGTPHEGPVRPYRSADSTARWLICDGHLPGARTRVPVVDVDVDADEAEARDLNTVRDDMAAGPCTYNRLEIGGHHAFTTVRPPDGQEGWDTCGQPASYPVHTEAPASDREPVGEWPIEQAEEAEVHRRQAVIRDQGWPTGFDANPGDTVVHVELGERGTFLRRNGDAGYVRYTDTTDPAGDLTHCGDLVVIERGTTPADAPRRSHTGPAELDTINVHEHTFANYNDDNDGHHRYFQGRVDYHDERVDLDRCETDEAYRNGVRDEYVAERLTTWRAEQAPTGWTPPAPKWTARTFAGEPAGYADEAEEAWRHRVERIDHWRRNGRLTDNEATALLAPTSPGAVIEEERDFRRGGTAGRFDPKYVDEVEQLWLDIEQPNGTCRYCGQSPGLHKTLTGPDGHARMAHPPWDAETGEGTFYDAPGVAAAAELVPGDPVISGGRHGIFEYLDESGTTAFVTFEGATAPETVPAGTVRAHGGAR